MCFLIHCSNQEIKGQNSSLLAENQPLGGWVPCYSSPSGFKRRKTAPAKPFNSLQLCFSGLWLVFFPAMQRKHKWHSVSAEEPDARHGVKSDPEAPGFYLTHMGLRKRCWFCYTNEIMDPNQPFAQPGSSFQWKTLKTRVWLKSVCWKQGCTNSSVPLGTPQLGILPCVLGSPGEGLLFCAKARWLYTKIYVPIRRPQHRVMP